MKELQSPWFQRWPPTQNRGYRRSRPWLTILLALWFGIGWIGAWLPAAIATLPHRETPRVASAVASSSSRTALEQQAADLHRQAITARQAADWDRVIADWEAALKLYAELNQAEEMALVAANLGTVYRLTGNYRQAIARLEQAIALISPLGKPLQQARIANNLGNVYITLGDYPAAIAQFRQALATAGIEADPSLVTTLHSNLGTAYLENGQATLARQHHEESVLIASRQGDRLGAAHALTNLATYHLVQQQSAQAQRHLHQGLTLAQDAGDATLLANILSNLGMTYDDDPAQAMSYQQQALAIARPLDMPHTLALILNNYAHAALVAQQLDLAESLLNEAISTLETLRENLNERQQVAIFQTQERTYNLLQQVLIAHDKPAAALEIAEWGRARTFANLLARHSVAADTVPQLATAPPPSLNLIRQVVQEQQATLVEYLLVPEDRPLAGRIEADAIALHIWVVQPDGYIHFQNLNFADPLNVSLLVQQLHLSTLSETRTVGANTVGTNTVRANTDLGRSPDPLLRRLHTLLIEPIAAHLPSDPEAQVIFIPHQALFGIPFTILQDTEDHYLIEQHTLSIAPSIQSLALTRDRWQHLQQTAATQSRTPLVIGNPIMPTVNPSTTNLGTADPLSPPLDPLPHAEQEAKVIAQLLGTNPLLREQATKSNVLAQAKHASVLHLATHGVTDTQWGLDSAIALSPTPTDAGWLTAREILDLQLPADLAVLSACDTGRGEVSADGIIGLVRSLAAAGIPSLVASLWSVPDASTAELMIAFYQHLQEQGDRPGRKVIALRQAMLDLLSTYPAPRDWAGFLLVGEGS